MANDLISEVLDKSKILDKAIGGLGSRGRDYAELERDYRMALNKKIIEERAKGTPVTIMSDICRGDAVVADLKFKRDCAEVMYKSCLEGINVLKLQVKVLESQIDREYNRK
jgi:hypothetical protein